MQHPEQPYNYLWYRVRQMSWIRISDCHICWLGSLKTYKVFRQQATPSVRYLSQAINPLLNDLQQEVYQNCLLISLQRTLCPARNFQSKQNSVPNLMNKIYLHDTWRILGSIAFVFNIAIPLTFRFLGAFFPLWGWNRNVFIANGAKWYLLSKNVELNLGARHSPAAL